MKPIIFSTPMVQAILDGKKTQTRRVIKIDDAPENWKISIAGTSIVRTEPYDVKLPRYAAGDILWVRETWFENEECLLYKASKYENTKEYHGRNGWVQIKWRPSIFMPRKAARIFLRVTNVRVERLQDISEEDARAEGVNGIPRSTVLYPNDDYIYPFKQLWNSLNQKRGYGWDTNPWVWVIEFERINKGGLK